MAPPRGPGGAAHQPAVAAAPGGSRAGSAGGVGSEAGPERGGGCAPGAAWRAPRRSDPSGRLLPGRCARPRPLCPRSPRPGPAPPRPWPSRVLFGPGGSRPGGARRGDRYGDAGAQRGRGWGRAHSPAASPPASLGGGAEGAGPGKAGLGPRGGRHQWGGGSACPGPARPKAPASHPVERARGDRCARRRAPRTRERGEGARCVTDGKAAGRLHLPSKMPG